jgi:phage gpG-like protein
MAGGFIFNVTLVGESQLVGRLTSLAAPVLQALRAKIEVLTINLQTHIVRDKLHGQVLNQRSGALARSIQRRVEASQMAVFGVVFSAGDVKYAHAHEFGFQGTVTVKQHMRTMVFGKEAALPFSVGPYSMRMNVPERSFMRSSLADQRQSISAGLRDAVTEGLRLGVRG